MSQNPTSEYQGVRCAERMGGDLQRPHSRQARPCEDPAWRPPGPPQRRERGTEGITPVSMEETARPTRSERNGRGHLTSSHRSRKMTQPGHPCGPGSSLRPEGGRQLILTAFPWKSRKHVLHASEGKAKGADPWGPRRNQQGAETLPSSHSASPRGLAAPACRTEGSPGPLAETLLSTTGWGVASQALQGPEQLQIQP